MTLRAPESREAMRHVEDGLAVGAGELDLRGIDAMGRPVGRQRRRNCALVGPMWGQLGMGRGPGHQLRRQHLRQLARVAREFGGLHRQDLTAAGAAHLHSASGPTTTLGWRWD